MARVALAGPRGRVVSRLEDGVKRLLENGEWDKSTKKEDRLEFYRAYLARFDWELDIVAEENRRPEHNGTAFVGGRVKGRAYLYDYKKGAVVCASDVDATNSSSQILEIDPRDKNVRGHQSLEDDLDGRAFEQAVNGLAPAVKTPAVANP